MMNCLYTKIRVLLAVFCLGSLASCTLYEADVNDENNEVAIEFHLDRDTLYLTQDEQYVFKPRFVPDTVANVQVYYQSLNDDVIRMEGATVIPRSVGWASVVAISVSSRLADTCQVCVLPPWEPLLESYPYETVVYAAVTVRGQHFSNGMTVAAYCNDELRGVGLVYEQNGISCMRIRVGSEQSEQSADGNYREQIVFRCYDSATHNFYTSSTRIPFDGMAHGTPSRPFQIDF